MNKILILKYSNYRKIVKVYDPIMRSILIKV